MHYKYFFIISCFIPLCFSSCFVEDIIIPQEPDPIKYPNVDEALWPHFENFELEGAKRGLTIDLNSANLTGTFRNIDDDHVAGQCSYSYYSPRRITIDIPFWNSASHLQREMIVFHELGHCFLGRDHLESSFESGYCRSIMRSGTCCCRDAYNSQNRAYYLDELFSIHEEL